MVRLGRVRIGSDPVPDVLVHAVAFAFLLVSLGGMFWLAGMPGVSQVIANASVSVTHFVFLPIPLFLLMGELFFNAGVAQRVFDAVDTLIGRMRGRLSYVTIFRWHDIRRTHGHLAWATPAMLGSLLVPEMSRRGYKKHMAMGPILGCWRAGDPDPALGSRRTPGQSCQDRHRPTADRRHPSQGCCWRFYT